jgi:DNA gyrase subunit A
VRVFKGRDSAGVRGIKLGAGDQVISMAILTHVEAEAEERAAFLRMRRALRGEEGENGAENGGEESEDHAGPVAQLSGERYSQMAEAEQFILTVSANGYGKRSSSYEYRVTGRGGKGIVAMIVNKRNGNLVASFPVGESDEIMLVSDGGQLIRCPVRDIRIAGRATQGVTIFDTAEDEHVVSVEHIPEEAEAEAQANMNSVP